MMKRAACMLLISAVLCGVMAMQTPVSRPQDTGSGSVQQEQTAEENKTEKEIEIPEKNIPQKPIGSLREEGLTTTLTPAEDYKQIFPYAETTAVLEDGSEPVYLYAFADAAGEFLTDPVYTMVQRLDYGDGFVWEMKDAEGNYSVAPQDGSWIIDGASGEIDAENKRIFIKQSEADVTDVYNLQGTLIGQIKGTFSSFSDGKIVTNTVQEAEAVWHVYHGTTTALLFEQQAIKLGVFQDGYASIQLSDTEWGFVNAVGEITPVDAVWLDDVCQGYALAKNAEGKYGILQVSGRVTADFLYVEGVRCGQEYPLYQLWKNVDSCIVLSANKGQKLELPEKLGRQAVTGLPNSYFAFIDSEERCTVIFDDLKNIPLEGYAVFYQQQNCLIAVQGSSYQIFDLNNGEAGKLIHYQYLPPKEKAGESDVSFTIVQEETGLQGIGNTKGRMVLKPVYDSISCVGDGYYMAMQENWSGIVDARGRWIVCTQLTEWSHAIGSGSGAGSAA